MELNRQNYSPSISNSSRVTAHGIVRFIWYSHFFLGFIIIYAGILKNGGDRYVTEERTSHVYIQHLAILLSFDLNYSSIIAVSKYVPIDPHAIKNHSHPCSKAYVNVHSLSVDDPHAIICCPPNSSGNLSSSSKYWSWMMGSYEVALCAGKVRKVSFICIIVAIQKLY
jgi:hypothetical protein